MSTFQKWMIGVAAGLIAIMLLFSFVDWEVRQTKRAVTEGAKAVLTPANADSAAKVAGRLIFEYKTLKKKVGAEVRRLQDSTEAKR